MSTININDIVRRAGRVEVNAAPLLIIIGAAMATSGFSGDLEDVCGLLFEQPEPEDETFGSGQAPDDDEDQAAGHTCGAEEQIIVPPVTRAFHHFEFDINVGPGA